MSVALFLAVAGSAGLGGWLAGRLARSRARRPELSTALPWGVPIGLGDVLVRAPDDEALLASALVLRDGESVAGVLFAGPRRGDTDRFVYASPPPAQELFWLAPCALGPLVDLPTHLPIDPPLPLVSRVTVRVERTGDAAPELGDVLVLATYRDARGRAAILLRGNETLTLLGDAIPLEGVDRLPGS